LAPPVKIRSGGESVGTRKCLPLQHQGSGFVIQKDPVFDGMDSRQERVLDPLVSLTVGGCPSPCLTCFLNLIAIRSLEMRFTHIQVTPPPQNIGLFVRINGNVCPVSPLRPEEIQYFSQVLTQRIEEISP